MFGQQVDDLEPLIEYARLCQTYGMRLWLGHSMMIESHVALAAVAGRGFRIETGLGVAVAPMRTPVDAFVQARSLATLMERPIAAGYGMGSPDMAARLVGHEAAAPGTYMRSYLEQIQAMKGSETGPSSATGQMIEAGCGILRPKMAYKAGGVADFGVTWLTPRDYIAGELRPALEKGAAAAGRTTPRLASVVPCALSGADRNPAQLASISCGRHIAAPHYADMFRKAGVDVTGDGPSDFRAAMKSGVFAYGTADEISRIVNSYWDIGVDEVVLNVGSVGLVHGTTTALHDLEQMLDAVARLEEPQFASTGR